MWRIYSTLDPYNYVIWEVVGLIMNSFTIDFFRPLGSYIVSELYRKFQAIGSVADCHRQPRGRVTILFPHLRNRELNAKVTSRATVFGVNGRINVHYFNQCKFDYVRLLIKSTMKRTKRELNYLPTSNWDDINACIFRARTSTIRVFFMEWRVRSFDYYICMHSITIRFCKINYLFCYRKESVTPHMPTAETELGPPTL
jgi:hypothetical protein